MGNPGAVSRRLIVAGLVVNVAAALTEFVWHPRPFGPHLLKDSIPVLLSLGGIVAVGACFARRKVRAPALLVRAGVGFIAPAERRFGYFVVGLLLLAALNVGAALRDLFEPGTTGSGRPLNHIVTGVLIGSAVLVSVVSYGFAGLALSGRPRLELTAEGVLLDQPFRRRTVRWDELVPGRPAHPPDRDSLILTVRGPAGTVSLPLFGVRVDTRFLADAIRFYAEHPESRAEIGTQPSYDHLVAALKAASVGQ